MHECAERLGGRITRRRSASVHCSAAFSALCFLHMKDGLTHVTSRESGDTGLTYTNKEERRTFRPAAFSIINVIESARA
jgi:hypothetical protein